MTDTAVLRIALALLVMAVLACGSAAPAQSLNVDFGDGHGGPPAGYAGAGLAGVWNVLSGDVSTPIPLVGLDGRPTAATIRVEGAAKGTFTDIPLPHPEIEPHRPLLGDAVLGAHGPEIPIQVTVDGLAAGTYRLITHTWYWPAELFALVAFVDSSPFVHPAGGPWPGAPVMGVTHMVHVIEIAEGDRASFQLVGDGPGAFFNGDILLAGVQLWKIDEAPPCPGDLDASGAVDVDDLVGLILAWGDCDPGACPADLDGDGAVEVDDLVDLILAWGPCPMRVPVRCGEERGLGDCYAAHAGPGCDEAACCAAICAVDFYCCDVAWDQACADLANLTADCAVSVHPNCGNPEAGPCTAPASVPGCDDPACCQAVCEQDTFCCRYGWDTLCVEAAARLCGGES